MSRGTRSVRASVLATSHCSIAPRALVDADPAQLPYMLWITGHSVYLPVAHRSARGPDAVSLGYLPGWDAWQYASHKSSRNTAPLHQKAWGPMRLHTSHVFLEPLSGGRSVLHCPNNVVCRNPWRPYVILPCRQRSHAHQPTTDGQRAMFPAPCSSHPSAPRMLLFSSFLPPTARIIQMSVTTES